MAKNKATKNSSFLIVDGYLVDANGNGKMANRQNYTINRPKGPSDGLTREEYALVYSQVKSPYTKFEKSNPDFTRMGTPQFCQMTYHPANGPRYYGMRNPQKLPSKEEEKKPSLAAVYGVSQQLRERPKSTGDLYGRRIWRRNELGQDVRVATATPELSRPSTPASRLFAQKPTKTKFQLQEEARRKKMDTIRNVGRTSIKKFKDVKRAFRCIDADKSGSVDIDELKAFFRAVNLSEAEAIEIWPSLKKLDVDVLPAGHDEPEVDFVDFLEEFAPAMADAGVLSYRNAPVHAERSIFGVTATAIA